MYKYYPYLQYSRVTWGYQSKEDAIAGDSTGGHPSHPHVEAEP